MQEYSYLRCSCVFLLFNNVVMCFLIIHIFPFEEIVIWSNFLFAWGIIFFVFEFSLSWPNAVSQNETDKVFGTSFVSKLVTVLSAFVCCNSKYSLCLKTENVIYRIFILFRQCYYFLCYLSSNKIFLIVEPLFYITKQLFRWSIITFQSGININLVLVLKWMVK